jgi:uncharacterized protein YjeT (DUF2065 family)
MADLIAALGLVLVLEGAALALVPDSLKRKLAALLEQPPAFLRGFGLAMAAAGVFVVWLARG